MSFVVSLYFRMSCFCYVNRDILLLSSEIVESVFLYERLDVLRSGEVVSVLPSYSFEWEFKLDLVVYFALMCLYLDLVMFIAEACLD